MPACTNHPDRKVLAKGLCNACYQRKRKSDDPEYAARARSLDNESSKVRRQQNPERIRAYDRSRWPDKRRKEIESGFDRIAVSRKSYLKRLYGMTVEEYAQMYVDQRGSCAICHEVPRQRLHVDHNHETGQVRGLLCSDCNHAIGQAHESPETLRAMASYLERWAG